ncbi:MAG: hypothetical protein J5616_08370 [Bacteroidaceae bacterium]|nr:hypothetical protein [Bacteroidaceae bacterium]
MDLNTNHWSVGEVATLPRTERPLKKNGLSAYGHYIGSRYICIREASEGQYGILVKVLGKVPAEYVQVVGGEPFCKDARDELFTSTRYLCYQFPMLQELKEALDIIRSNPTLIPVFEKASMHINPKSTFWVRETASQFLILKKPQIYDALKDVLSPASNESAHYRLSIVHYNKSELIFS